LLLAKQIGCSRVFGLWLSADALAIMESARLSHSFKRPMSASRVIGFVASGTDTLAMMQKSQCNAWFELPRRR
jgi:hypothetical protein